LIRALDIVMAIVFGISALLQWNDPDPWPWALIYGGAAVVSGMSAARASTGRLAPTMIAVVAILWGVWVLTQISGGIAWSHLAESMKADSPQIEESRETLGLFLTAAWMGFVAFRRGRGTRKPAR
jgi:Transmembrane family 220, helix